MRELGELADRKEAFARLGTDLYALSMDPVEKLVALQEELGDAVTLLSDPEGRAVDAFGMRDEDPFPSRDQARAGTFLLDRSGRVVRRWLATSYRKRPDADAVLRDLRG